LAALCWCLAIFVIVLVVAPFGWPWKHVWERIALARMASMSDVDDEAFFGAGKSRFEGLQTSKLEIAHNETDGYDLRIVHSDLKSYIFGQDASLKPGLDRMSDWQLGQVVCLCSARLGLVKSIRYTWQSDRSEEPIYIAEVRPAREMEGADRETLRQHAKSRKRVIMDRSERYEIILRPR